MPTMKNDERSQATGSTRGLLPKDEETMKAGLMKVAVDNPLPSDEEDFKDLDGKADDIKDRGKDREASQYGKIKAGKIRKGAQRTDDSQEDYGFGISPDRNSGQATSKEDKRIPAQKV